MIRLLNKHYPFGYIVDMDISVVCDMVFHAQDTENERRRWEEWCAFSPSAALFGRAVNYEQFKRKQPKETATDKDIEDIRRRYGL